MVETEKAYIAGLIDGEGTISLIHDYHKNKHGKKDYSYDSYSVVLRIYNSDKRMIDWVADTTGYGNVRVAPMGNTNWDRSNVKTMYLWAIYANNMRLLLPDILPYLVIKKRQAEIMIDFLELTRVKGKYITDDQRLLKKKLCLEMLQLNQRGIKKSKSLERLEEEFNDHVSL